MRPPPGGSSPPPMNPGCTAPARDGVAPHPTTTTPACSTSCARRLTAVVAGRLANRRLPRTGDGTVAEVPEAAGLHTIFPTFGSSWGDYNNDGYPDLFLSASLGRPQLFRNNGDGTFTDVGVEAGLTDFVVGTSCFFCAYDNDRWLDIVHITWSDHEDAVHTIKTGHGPA